MRKMIVNGAERYVGNPYSVRFPPARWWIYTSALSITWAIVVVLIARAI